MTHAAPAPQRPTAMMQGDFFTALFGALLKLELVGELLDGLSVERVLALIDEGQLRAINIARDLASARQLRVWRWSLEARLVPALRRKIEREGTPTAAMSLPHSREYLRAIEVCRLLDCSDQHVLNLHADGTLAGRRDGKPGAQQRLLRIERASLLHFLATRELQP